MNYAEWSRAWKDARHDSTSIDRVLDLWRLRPPKECLRESWPTKSRRLRPTDLGYRKVGIRDAPAGEQVIEKALLGSRGSIREHRLVHGSRSLVLRADLHNMALSTEQGEQVIADAFGILEARDSEHPIAIEVKVTQGGWWSAVVQCLQQVRILRFNIDRLQAFCADHLGATRARGAWGMVLAPATYFEKSEHLRAKACLLLERLRDTQARIIVAESGAKGTEWLERQEVRYVAGHWPLRDCLSGKLPGSAS